ncbi:BAR domain-containing protein [Thiomicrorhabdus heinhorstiae]|uniref:Lipoprotein n=1 Tax=Thiomicrorhabdus heinhorstiae TaxID=2748010 RepID=A0ABS0BTC8_9GAMM|nr:hypothetical protein [Thiomicrorhabdus heinhorstiae]MBF6057102.1 hypothetical protein [Thiomicrorhabdus heinhorstiae]
MRFLNILLITAPILLTGCSSGFYVYDNESEIGCNASNPWKKCGGIPFREQKLFAVTRTVTFKVSEKFKDKAEAIRICNQSVSEEVPMYLPLGKQRYIHYEKPIMGSSNFTVQFDRTGSLLGLSVASDSSQIAKAALNTTGTVASAVIGALPAYVAAKGLADGIGSVTDSLNIINGKIDFIEGKIAPLLKDKEVINFVKERNKKSSFLNSGESDLEKSGKSSKVKQFIEYDKQLDTYKKIEESLITLLQKQSDAQLRTIYCEIDKVELDKNIKAISEN